MAAKPISPHAVEAAKDNDYSATSWSVFHVRQSETQTPVLAAWEDRARSFD
jgi:hypothetical protein